MSETKLTKIIAEHGSQELFIYREFDAPKELVYRAFTEPDLIVQWLGAENWRIDQYEHKSGGRWRFVYKGEMGEFAMRGIMHELAQDERLIRTFEMEGLPEKGHVSLEIALFESAGERKTKLTLHTIYSSVADRDGSKSAIEKNVTDHHLRMDQLFKKIIQ
ncbi:MAG: SRPBCC domain-containing protein [Taibaiella sp.]|nr:SRPBCC domain-containing protein [Taibaiella sp.]